MEIKLSKEIGDFLLNVENPLLTSYKEKAPGSFKHSEEVANLCDKIGSCLLYTSFRRFGR